MKLYTSELESASYYNRAVAKVGREFVVWESEVPPKPAVS